MGPPIYKLGVECIGCIISSTSVDTLLTIYIRQNLHPTSSKVKQKIQGVQKKKLTVTLCRYKLEVNVLNFIKYILINNKYTSSLRGLCYIMWKKCISNIPGHCFYRVVYYSVCAIAHLIMCMYPDDRKARFELHISLTS